MLDVLTVPLQAEGTHNGSTSCADAQGNVPVKKVAMRLAALDIVRGFTVAVMIFVDDAGDSLQHINHAPWHGLNLADIVMPWFLFMVGNAMAFSLKITTGSGRCAQLQKLIIRAVKLFLLGLVLQGGGLPEATWETWGFNLATIRWCGILQRIAFAYLVVGLTAMYVPRRPAAGTMLDLLHVYAWQWAVAALFAAMYLILMLATPVGDWTVANTPNSIKHGIAGKVIKCDNVRGDWGVSCNAAGHYDRLLFGQPHLYQPGEKVRLPECSTCSPGECWGKDPALQPTICWAPFDPEGAVPCLMTVMTAFIGLHFGRAMLLARAQPRAQRALVGAWGVSVGVCAALGLLLIPAFPVNKQLWTPSYALVNAALTGGALLLVYVACDVFELRAVVLLLKPFQWMGMNALFVFVMAACGVFETLVDAVYLDDKEENNLTARIHHALEIWFPGSTTWDDHGVANVIYVLLKVMFWLAVSGLLHRFKWYWKL
jgi:heparan-alpha-glucosaminide N-acetyltransferase